jgi:hypothetical protein
MHNGAHKWLARTLELLAERVKALRDDWLSAGGSDSERLATGSAAIKYGNAWKKGSPALLAFLPLRIRYRHSYHFLNQGQSGTTGHELVWHSPAIIFVNINCEELFVLFHNSIRHTGTPCKF